MFLPHRHRVAFLLFVLLIICTSKAEIGLTGSDDIASRVANDERLLSEAIRQRIGEMYRYHGIFPPEDDGEREGQEYFEKRDIRERNGDKRMLRGIQVKKQKHKAHREVAEGADSALSNAVNKVRVLVQQDLKLPGKKGIGYRLAPECTSYLH